jgi:RNA polymerase sigma-B factor
LTAPPTVCELAAATDSSNEEVLDALQARSGRNTLSLQTTRGGARERPTLQDVLGTADGGYAQAEMRVFLANLMIGLPRRTREILRLRFEEDLTQQEIGERIGISQMQISRTIHQAIRGLREIADQHEQMLERRTETARGLALEHL